MRNTQRTNMQINHDFGDERNPKQKNQSIEKKADLHKKKHQQNNVREV